MHKCDKTNRMPFFFKYSKLAVLFSVLFFVFGCASTPYTDRSQFIIVSESQEIQLGLEASNELLKTEKIEVGTANARLVTTIGKRLAAVADRPDFKWEFHTITKNELNAFCLPGGKIFVYTGLIKLLGSNPDELAAVMGHEVAHAIARHGAERMSQSMMAQVGTTAATAAVAIGTGSDEKAVMAGAASGALMQLGLLLPYSRTHETEADRIGIILAAKAGYDPRASIRVWEKMGQAAGGKEQPAFLSTHPVNSKRIADLQKFMPEAMKYYKK